MELYRMLLKEYDKEWGLISDYTEECLDKMELNYEDLLVIAYIRILAGDIRSMEQISHVVLDEAQDYNRLQLLILKALYPKSRFTVLADSNQAVYPVISTMDPEEFKKILGRNMKEVPLNKSYRSTAPINAYAFDILGIHDSDLYVDRPGKEPEEIGAHISEDNSTAKVTSAVSNNILALSGTVCPQSLTLFSFTSRADANQRFSQHSL
jgi:DNA helicase-2/ATP-dependent DNA helicase PcrA